MEAKFLSKYLLISTLIGIFSEALRTRNIIDLKFFYLVIILNLAILFLCYFKHLSFTKFGFLVLVAISICSFLNIYLGKDTLSNFLAQIIGISICAFYFYNFFKFSEYSVEYIFKKYCAICFYVSVLGIIHFIYMHLTGDNTYRLQSVFTEAAHFSGMVLPSFYYFLKSFKSNKLKFLTVFSALILSASSIGYLGILMAIILFPKKVNLIPILFLSLFSFGVGLIVYNYAEFFKMRVDDTLIAYSSIDVTDANLSTYALISNYYVATKVFRESPLIGNGLGSHELSHKKYIDKLEGADTFNEVLRAFNREDANSLFLRILSDLGLFGILLITLFIYKNLTYLENHNIISKAILIYFFYKLFREGHYFSPEMYFFVFSYYFIKKSENKNLDVKIY